jgi:NAD-specific glutamate dehydrogenase
MLGFLKQTMEVLFMKMTRIENRLLELFVEEYFAWSDKKSEKEIEEIRKKLRLYLSYIDESRKDAILRKVDIEITGQYYEWKQQRGYYESHGFG